MCGLAVVLAIGYGANVGFAEPRQLIGVAGWSAVVLAVLFGHGGAVRRALRIQLSVGEQLVAGTLVWVGVGGVLLAVGVASRTTLLALAGIGGALALVEIATFVRAKPAAPAGVEDRIVAWTLGIALAIVLFVGLLATAGTRANPYAD